jgi:Leucine-rich repeat (LRR) protein
MDFGQSYLQSATNFIRILKGRRREQRAAAFGALCFLAATFLKSRQWIPNWKGYAVAAIALYAIGAIAFAYAFVRLWRATHAPDLPPPKDRPSAIKGVDHFKQADGELFRRLGRESELQELMGYVLDNQTRLVVLMGESGAGKTSLLRAGLPHILKGRAQVHYWEAVPTDSAERLLRAIQEDWSTPNNKDAAKPAALEDLINPADTLGNEQHVIVLDQFEQLRGRNAVLALLRRIARESLPPHRITWIVAFRREYRADWADLMIPEQEHGFYPKEMPSLRLFSKEAARDVISQLIQEAGLQVEQPVVNNLIEAAANADNQVSPVDLGIGLLVLAELHEGLGGRTLTVKDYQFAGGAEGLLTQYINRCFERFAETEREPLLKALLALRNPETNQRLAEGLPLDQLAAEAATDARRLQPQLERLAQRDIRLLETVAKDGVTHYRLPHERLIPALHRLTGKLLGEIEQARLRFENAFLAWEKNDKRRHYLIKGKDLKLIERNASQMPWGSAAQEKQKYLRQSLRRRGFVRMGALATAIALIAVGWMGSLYYQRIEGRRYLSERGYPPELYDYQHGLKKLEMKDELDLERFTWLSSNSLEELSLKAASSSNSIAGLATLARCRSLKKLTLDLSESQVSDVKPLEQLKGLTQLSLSLNRQVRDVKPLEQLKGLTQLTLAFSGAQVSNLEPLSKLDHLAQLALDLSYSQVGNLEPLSKLSNQTELALSISGNPVSNLELLANLNHLTQLALDLGNGQPSNLEPLTKLSNQTQLTLILTGNQMSNLEPLVKSINPPQLAFVLNDGQGSNMELMVKLSDLPQLALSLKHSRVDNLELLAKLNNLTQLMLDLSYTKANNLEPLTKLGHLTRLILNLRKSQVNNLEPLAKLRNLTELSLDLRDSKVSDLESLAKLNNQTRLTLSFNGNQVSNLEPLVKLSNLIELMVDLSDSQEINLGLLAKLGNLTQLTLDLGLSPVSNLEPIIKLTNLKKLDISNATRAQRMSLQKLPPSVVDLSF